MRSIGSIAVASTSLATVSGSCELHPLGPMERQPRSRPRSSRSRIRFGMPSLTVCNFSASVLPHDASGNVPRLVNRARTPSTERGSTLRHSLVARAHTGRRVGGAVVTHSTRSSSSLLNSHWKRSLDAGSIHCRSSQSTATGCSSATAASRSSTASVRRLSASSPRATSGVAGNRADSIGLSATSAGMAPGETAVDPGISARAATSSDATPKTTRLPAKRARR